MQKSRKEKYYSITVSKWMWKKNPVDGQKAKKLAKIIKFCVRQFSKL